MTTRSNYLMSYFYYVVIFFIVSAINILPQDNTNNMMQDKTDRSTENAIQKRVEQNANYYSSDLKTVLNLTDSQMRYIYDYLLEYYSREIGNQTSQRAALRESKKTLNQETNENNDDLFMNASAVNKKIENILDREQMDKWKDRKDSWWENVKSELYMGDQRIQWSKDLHEKKGQYEDDRDYENFDVYYPGYDFK